MASINKFPVMQWIVTENDTSRPHGKMKHLWSCRDSILSYKMIPKGMTINGSINGPWIEFLGGSRWVKKKPRA